MLLRERRDGQAGQRERQGLNLRSQPGGTCCLQFQGEMSFFFFFFNVLFFYFKRLQLNELLFRSLPLFIQKYCAS